MTPKFKYDPEQHCLREVARISRPAIELEWDHPIQSTYPTNQGYQYWANEWHEYNQHLASLRVIKCFAHSWWTEGDYVEGVSFEVIKGIYGERAIPKDPPQPRLYTQAEADEIWYAAERIGVQCYTACKSSKKDKQQFFKTRFNVELTPQTP